MSYPYLFALGLSILTLLIYFYIGAYKKKSINTIDDFLLYSRSLPTTGYQNTFIATSISLATVLFFFLDYTGICKDSGVKNREQRRRLR